VGIDPFWWQNEEKCRFLLKSVKNICIIQLKSVPLQRQKVGKVTKMALKDIGKVT